MSRPEVKVFYSWQTDLPRPHNYTLIRKALERAVENIQKDGLFPVFPILERDTFDRSGSVAIADTILEKIKETSVFVGDVSIINKGSRKRKTSNPNVLLETGFAVHRLGWARVVLVNNDHYGKVESLPFDIRHRRLLRYKFGDSGTPNADVRNGLRSRFEQQLRGILGDAAEQEEDVELVRFKRWELKAERLTATPTDRLEKRDGITISFSVVVENVSDKTIEDVEVALLAWAIAERPNTHPGLLKLAHIGPQPERWPDYPWNVVARSSRRPIEGTINVARFRSARMTLTGKIQLPEPGAEPERFLCAANVMSGDDIIGRFDLLCSYDSSLKPSVDRIRRCSGTDLPRVYFDLPPEELQAGASNSSLPDAR